MPQPTAPIASSTASLVLEQHDRARAVAAAALPATLDKRRFESQALFGGQVEIEIEHFSQVYRLRQTALGKLILTK